MSAIVIFMIVEVFNDEELQTIAFARKHNLVHKNEGEANVTTSLMLFPAMIFKNNSLLLPGKDLK